MTLFNGTLNKLDDFEDDNNSFRIYVKSCVGSFSRRRRNASDDRRRSEVVVVVVPKFGKKIPGAFISAATTTAASCFDFTHMQFCTIVVIETVDLNEAALFPENADEFCFEKLHLLMTSFEDWKKRSLRMESFSFVTFLLTSTYSLRLVVS